MPVEALPDDGRITLGTDKNCDTHDFAAEMRRLGVTPHVTQNKKRRSAIDGRATRHAGYAASPRIRKRIEEVFGWMKTVGVLRKTRHRGAGRVGWMFPFVAVADNLVRLPKLLAGAAQPCPDSVQGYDLAPPGQQEPAKPPRARRLTGRKHA